MDLTVPAALCIAWALDACFGEPPNAFHPVAWLGRVLGPVGRWLCGLPTRPAFLGGTIVWLVLAGLLARAAHGAQSALASTGVVVGALLPALLLKPCFAWRMLHDEVAAVEQALQQTLAAGRDRVARLASRDVGSMNAFEVRETAIETLAENLNDSLVAPLFWFVVAGLPGAAVYRFANTADAMWGYHGRYEWAGKWAARADDVLSWLPARLTALLLWPFGAEAGWRRLRLEAARPPSWNGGWAMGAMALRLQVSLRKPGVYVLNPAAPSPSSADVARALGVASTAAWMALGIAVLASLARTGATTW